MDLSWFDSDILILISMGIIFGMINIKFGTTNNEYLDLHVYAIAEGLNSFGGLLSDSLSPFALKMLNNPTFGRFFYSFACTIKYK